jgi:hypothetical protein
VTAVLPERLRDPANWLSHRRDATPKEAGQIACFAPRNKLGGLQGLLERMAETLDTGDLQHIGDMRYVIARPAENGRTLVLVMWSEGSFNIPAMFPESGDSPGSDPAHAPRPPAAVRVLSAEIKDHPMAYRMYDSDKSYGEVLKSYADEMAARGWVRQGLPAAPEDFDINDRVSVFAKDNAAFIVVTNDTPQDKTGVTLIDIGTRGFAETTLP